MRSYFAAAPLSGRLKCTCEARPGEETAVHVVLLLAFVLFGASGPSSTVRFDIAADPTNLNPLFAHPDAASVEAQLARLVFEPFIDIDEHGRMQPELLSEIPTPKNGDVSTRRPHHRLQAATRRSVERRRAGNRQRRSLYAARDRRSAQSRAFARRIRSHPKRVCGRCAHGRDALPARVGAGGRDLFPYGASPQYVLPAHLLVHAGSLAEAAFNQHPIGDGPFVRIMASR